MSVPSGSVLDQAKQALREITQEFSAAALAAECTENPARADLLRRHEAAGANYRAALVAVFQKYAGSPPNWGADNVLGGIDVMVIDEINSHVLKTDPELKSEHPATAIRRARKLAEDIFAREIEPAAAAAEEYFATEAALTTGDYACTFRSKIISYAELLRQWRKALLR